MQLFFEFKPMYKNAIVRTPAPSMIAGLTTSASLGKPDFQLALTQHQDYIDALRQCGVDVSILPANADYPDACFVEDVALLTANIALLTRPGALSRQGEVALIEPIIHHFYGHKQHKIQAPGTLEAGDVLRINNHFYIGLSERTNLDGAEQMLQVISNAGYTGSTIPLIEFLHLKTGVSYLDKNYVLVAGELVNHPAFSHLNQIIVEPDEAYATNCIYVNGRVLLPAGFPKIAKTLSDLGFSILPVDVSEFQKIDGGLSCLSLRF